MIGRRMAAGALWTALAAMLAPAAAAAQPPVSHHAHAGFTYLVPDADRDADFGWGARVGYGIPLAANAALELAAYGNRVRRDRDRGRDGAVGGGGDLVFTLGRGAVRPLALAGVGGLREQVRGTRETGFYANLGMGFVAATGLPRLTVRGDARWLVIFNDLGARGRDPLGDLHFTLGVQVPLYIRR